MLLSVDEINGSMGEAKHVSVLLDASMDYLRPEQGGVFLDGTFGGGGHTRAILERASDVIVVAIDQDPEAEKRAELFEREFGDRFKFYAMNFSELDRVEEGDFDGVLFDFGLSSFQLDSEERGFSFRFNAPLDMRMNNREGITASEFLETASEAELIEAVRDFGEERSWRKVVGAILKARGTGVLSETKSFAQLIEETIPSKGFKSSKGFKPSKIHPATKTFQGVRIAINNELDAIRIALESAFRRLKSGGVLVAISFHSLEDRIVKRFFRRLAGRPEHRNDGQFSDERAVLGKMIATKAVQASESEISQNPRSRSARMRGVQKL